MLKTAIITGGGTGLGQALAKQLAGQKISVVIIGRRLNKLLETKKFSPAGITVIKADVSRLSDRKLIVKKLLSLDKKIDYLIHNAAIAAPIEPFEKITLSAFRQSQAVNLEGPLFLTQLLLPCFNLNARILHISSDCAHTGLAHWIPYCVSKAGLFMLYQCLKKEFAERYIHVGSIDPGMMDTPMQDYICSEQVKFPEKTSRAELKKQGLILSAEYSARYCLKLLLKSSVQTFSQKERCAYLN